MMEPDMDDEFCLRWNSHHSTFMNVLHSLLQREVLVDVTLAAEGKFIEAHRLVLCTCSDYFQEALSTHVNKHAFIFLNNVAFDDLKALVDYMYKGEVNVSQEQLPRFLATAEALKIKGLSDRNNTSSDENKTQPTQSGANSYGQMKHSRCRPVSSTSTSPSTTKPNHSPSHHLSSHALELQDEDSDNQSQNEDHSNNLKEGQSVLDDNFIAVEANDDVDLDQTENEVAGIGTLGRVWSLNESQPNDWDRGTSLTDGGSLGDATSFSTHDPTSALEIMQQFMEPLKADNLRVIKTEEEIIPGPSKRKQLSSPIRNSSTTKGKQGTSSGSENSFSSGKVSCPTCGRCYSQKGSLNRHLKYECSIVPKFPCHLCPLRFRRGYKLTEHIARCHSNDVSHNPINNEGKMDA